MSAVGRALDRRGFLQGLLGAATTAALAPLALGRHAHAGDPAEFAAGLRTHPWLAGWRGARAEALGPQAATITGRWPAALRGTLYRNGPAWFERAGFRYEHWFDGDGMVQAWRMGDGAVVHRGRMVETPKFARERKAGRFVVPAAGTRVPDPKPVRNNDDANPANTSVMVLGGRVFALCEAGSAFEVDPDSLETLGTVRWRDDLATLPFSAHPLVDRDGSVWNFGGIGLMGGGTDLLLWQLGPDGAVRQARTLACPALGYLHSFAMTDTHLVFVLAPFELADSGAFFERLRFQPTQAARIAVVPKADLADARWFEADFAMAYHFADACRRGDEIIVRAVVHDDLETARSPMAHAMRGRGGEPRGEVGRLARLHLDLRSGRARWAREDVRGLEFAVFDARSRTDRAATLYAPVCAGDAPSFNAVMSLDARGRRRVHRYGDGVLAEEHVFVPRPGSSAPDDGWLVGTLLDTRRDRHGLAVLDARRVDGGPIAEAWLPYAMPLGFHGTFAAV
ncbi:carotenoid oxygenase family protein [Lysobacter humi (ex Lee et al. 2017)]